MLVHINLLFIHLFIYIFSKLFRLAVRGFMMSIYTQMLCLDIYQGQFMENDMKPPNIDTQIVQNHFINRKPKLESAWICWFSNDYKKKSWDTVWILRFHNFVPYNNNALYCFILLRLDIFPCSLVKTWNRSNPPIAVNDGKVTWYY